jgi:hypothetical protein
MAVEKPGVPFLHQTSSPGSCAGCPPEFLRAYRFDRWLETLVAAVNATRALPDIAPAPLLVAGVSEGCLMAAHVAANIAAVTHVALLSAEGAPQLTHFVWDAWDADGSAEERHAEVERLFEMFEGMRRRPDNMDDWWLGHPHQRWATFAMQSTVDGLARTGAQIYVAYGTEDLPRSGDLLRANLLAMGKEFVAERILGGDHCLRVPDAGRERDIREVLERVIGWSVGVLAAHER